jgi:hypothetical protein
MTIAYDAVNALLIPRSPPPALVIGYIDGPVSQWKPEWWSLFPRTGTNSVFANIAADGCDLESGNASLTIVAGCMVTRYHQSKRSRLYYNPNVNKQTDVEAYLAQYLPRSAWDWWCCNQTGTPHLYPGSVMTQYLDAGGYDVSVVDDAYYASLYPPANLPPEAIKMLSTAAIVQSTDATGKLLPPQYIIWADGTKTAIAQPAPDLATLWKLTGQTGSEPLSQGTLTNIPTKVTGS